MTKKDYLALADEFLPLLMSLRGGVGANDLDTIVYKIEIRLTNAASKGNERFDKNKFLGYLRGTHGPNGGKKK